MTPPRDWQMTVSDHGSRFLVEVRDAGCLVLRTWRTHDEVAIEDALGHIVSDALRHRFERRGGGGR